MRKKIIYNLCYYSYIVVYVVFIIYLIVYSVFLREMSIYYTYLMIFFSGILLGYIVADKVHRYLKKNIKKDIEKQKVVETQKNLTKMNKSTKFLSVMALLMPVILLISSVFNDELLKSGYYIYFAIFGVIILTLGALSVILYYISKKRKQSQTQLFTIKASVRRSVVAGTRCSA